MPSFPLAFARLKGLFVRWQSFFLALLLDLNLINTGKLFLLSCHFDVKVFLVFSAPITISLVIE